ncbi:hypothetical protein Tco_0664611 [Tanacetum coccineum]
MQTTVDSLNAAITAQNDHLAKWVESYALLAWSVGPRMNRIKNTQASIQSDLASLKQDILKSRVQQLLGESSAHTATITPTEETPSHTKKEKDEMVTKEIVHETENVEKESVKELEVETVEKELVQKPHVTEPIPIIIMYQLIEEEIQAHLDKEEKLEKAVREARLRKPELINVVHEEATKAGVDPKALSSVKGGQEFIKIQDAKFKVLNREHSEKIKKSRELRKKRIEQYRWTTSSILKLEIITDIKIHPNTKPVAITVYRGTDKRNFDVHKPFKFGDFDVFGDEAFQRMNDIHKVDGDTLLTYLMMASNVSTPANQRFCLALRSLIDSHPDKEKQEKDEEMTNKFIQVRRIPHQDQAWETFQEQKIQQFKLSSPEIKPKSSYIRE